MIKIENIHPATGLALSANPQFLLFNQIWKVCGSKIQRLARLLLLTGIWMTVTFLTLIGIFVIALTLCSDHVWNHVFAIVLGLHVFMFERWHSRVLATGVSDPKAHLIASTNSPTKIATTVILAPPVLLASTVCAMILSSVLVPILMGATGTTDRCVYCGEAGAYWAEPIQLFFEALSIYWLACGRATLIEEIHASRDRLLFRKGNSWQTLALADISQLSTRRKTSIADSDYHEDDNNQHLLCFVSTDGKAITLDPEKLKAARRLDLFNWLNKHMDKRTFSTGARSMLWHNGCAEAEKVAKKETEFSLTAAWQEDMNRRIMATNYVPLEQGQSLQEGRFTVNGYLSSGGFSTTYLATNLEGKTVVLKESALPSGLGDASRAQVSEMFAREARLLKRCSHKNIAAVLDFFQENNREYLVLEHIDGSSLWQLVRGAGALSEAQVIKFGIAMADFLAYLHALEPPVIHRDFTPENLLLHRNGEIYLIDFGAANEFIGQATGTLIGKQSYIAPEQLQGKAAPESDIYALGATLYFLLAGKEPLPLTELHMVEDGLNCSPALSEIVAACTRLDPQQRIRSAFVLKEKLSDLQS
jgi:hypothetical protein